MLHAWADGPVALDSASPARARVRTEGRGSVWSPPEAEDGGVGYWGKASSGLAAEACASASAALLSPVLWVLPSSSMGSGKPGLRVAYGAAAGNVSRMTVLDVRLNGAVCVDCGRR